MHRLTPEVLAMVGKVCIRLADYGPELLRTLLEWALAQGDLSGFGAVAGTDPEALALSAKWAAGYEFRTLISGQEVSLCRGVRLAGLIGYEIDKLDREAGRARREVLRKFPDGLPVDPVNPNVRRSLMERAPVPRRVVEWVLRQPDLSGAWLGAHDDGTSFVVRMEFPGLEPSAAAFCRFRWYDASKDPAWLDRLLDDHAERLLAMAPRYIPVMERFGYSPMGR